MSFGEANGLPRDLSFPALKLTITPKKAPHEFLNLLGDGDGKDENRSPIDLHRRKDREDKLESTGKRERFVAPIT